MPTFHVFLPSFLCSFYFPFLLCHPFRFLGISPLPTDTTATTHLDFYGANNGLRLWFSLDESHSELLCVHHGLDGQSLTFTDPDLFSATHGLLFCFLHVY